MKTNTRRWMGGGDRTHHLLRQGKSLEKENRKRTHIYQLKTTTGSAKKGKKRRARSPTM